MEELLYGFDEKTGGLKYITDARDEAGMNWVEGKRVFGEINGGELVTAKAEGSKLIAEYKTKHLTVLVTREYSDGIYRERYVFRNDGVFDVFFNRGAVGIYATFNDSYEAASISMKKHCNAHIWCGGEVSWVNAVKMGPYDRGLMLVLTEGALDTYSVERDLAEWSNDRGDFILHPVPFRLAPGEEYAIAWEMKFYRSGEFLTELKKYDIPVIEGENYTVYLGEKIRFTVDKPAEVSLNGEVLQATTENGITRVEFEPKERGEYVFDVKACGKTTHAKFFAQIPFDELVKRRVHFIVDNQQYDRAGDSLDGAYLIYDNQDKCLIYDEVFSDYNATRERLVMGLLVAKYVQYYPDDKKVYDSLMKYYRFVAREFFDEETGTVYNAVGKNPTAKRLYNAPWMSVFVMEMYKVTGEEKYLEMMVKLLRVYYSIGGEKFYPNGLSLYETVDVLRRAGMTAEADEILGYYKIHVGNIVKNGIAYPEHEVRYEQTIVTPAVNMIAQLYLLTGDKSLITECAKHIDVLERFNGCQPSHYLNDLAIRHWDGYWFGKRMIYGDTFPHSASVHTSDAFLHYYWISGDTEYRDRAIRGARNCLSLFGADGSANTSYVYPLFCNGVRCEYYDEFANEQDGYLYFMIKFFGELGNGCENAR